ncbi:MAG: hypothetical protein KF819_11335 [Labilithrix sp.]|nr:hypothetical protein [Labilithrix sp.]
MRAVAWVVLAVSACGVASPRVATLAEKNLVSIDAGTIVPASGVVPYDVQNPLFTDYASKARTIYVPPGTRARYAEGGVFEFPVGSIATKSFGYEGRWIETRLLVREPGGWKGYAYTWDDAQREAVLRPGGAVIPIGSRSTHLVPSQSQCKKCHADGDEVVPIGLRADQLGADQLAAWTRRGILEGAPSSSRAAHDDRSRGSIADRARAYLDSNCAHCHNPTGSARTTGLFLGRDVDAPPVLGVCKSPVAAGRASGGLRYDVVPGAPERSILIHRMRATEPAIMMPEIGRSLVHREGVELVEAWIAGLSGDCRP